MPSQMHPFFYFPSAPVMFPSRELTLKNLKILVASYEVVGCSVIAHSRKVLASKPVIYEVINMLRLKFGVSHVGLQYSLSRHQFK